MKTPRFLLAALIASTLSIQAQNAPGPTPGTPKPSSGAELPAVPPLVPFSLDFAGGSPQDLVNAIRKATGKPLNAIIRDEYADIRIPPLKMNNVTLPQLFIALEQASFKRVTYVSATSSSGSGRPLKAYSSQETSYSFSTIGPITDQSVWYFGANLPAMPPASSDRVCRFYLLTPYLERDFTVEDITTAVKTAWKMLDEDAATISYHKDTQLLIAVGEPDKLETIDMVLQALNAGNTIDPATGLPIQPRKLVPGKPAVNSKARE